MITEDYVSFETAKLLKEKGFDGECHSHYYAYRQPDGSVQYHTGEVYSLKSIKDFYLAPTLQMAMKWLREVHKLIPIILAGGDSYWFSIDKANEDNWKNTIYREDVKSFPTYEEACEAAIKYCLLENQKKSLPIPDKINGLKSLMLQYLQSAANRKDDTEIENDTNIWAQKILDYLEI